MYGKLFRIPSLTLLVVLYSLFHSNTQLSRTVIFFLYVIWSHFNELFPLRIHLKITPVRDEYNFLTGPEAIEATNGFKHIAAMGTKLINTETVSFLLSACR